jgi:GntR family transcriptional regulator of vanillate catabolism
MSGRRARSDSHTDRLIFSLRELILHGKFTPGQRLTELGLVPLLGASRTPVRLALERLAYEGLVEIVPTGGFRVRAFTVPEILDAIEIRGVLEGTAVRMAAERLASSHDLSELKALQAVATLDIPVTIEGFGRFLALNDRFHHEFWRLSKSPPLIRALEQACRIPFVAPSAAVFVRGERDTADVFVAAEHHRAIVEAIEAREGTRAEALAREHSYIARRTLLLALERRQDADDVPGSALIVGA